MRKSIHDDENILLVEMLKEARLKAGLSQQELSDRLSNYRTFVSKYEARERRLDVAEVRKICRELDLVFIEFLSEYDKECRALPISLVRDKQLRRRL